MSYLKPGTRSLMRALKYNTELNVTSIRFGVHTRSNVATLRKLNRNRNSSRYREFLKKNFDKKMKLKRCPVCGQHVRKIDSTTDGRFVLSCGDAVWYTADRLGRIYWWSRRPKNYWM